MTAVSEQIGNWLSLFSAAPKSKQAWVQELRDRAFAKFGELGFPTTHDEEWRFTNVAPIARTAFRPAADVRVAYIPDYAEGVRVVFLNGRYSAELSSQGEGLPKGVKAGRLAEDPEFARQYIGKYAGFDQQAFVALNTAFLEDAAVVRIPRGAVVEQPIHLVFLTFPGAEPQAAHPRTLIVSGADSQSTIVESYIGLGEEPYLNNAVTEVVAGEASVIDHYKVQLEGAAAYHVAAMHAQVGRSANFSSHSISLGGALVRNDPWASLSEGSHATLNGLYIATGTQHVDNHTAIDHAKPHATSHEIYKGILDGKATAVFNGKIFVRVDAQKTDSKQTNKNLVLSDEAIINTKPELQILADDVRCTHGATIGQLDAESMFYLRSRGIGESEARNLLIYAFAQDINDRIKVEPLRNRLEKVLFDKFHEHPE
jgi:Fe-S cluster assembly protein SufD